MRLIIFYFVVNHMRLSLKIIRTVFLMMVLVFVGMDLWKRKQLHSHIYRVPDPFRDEVIKLRSL